MVSILLLFLCFDQFGTKIKLSVHLGRKETFSNANFEYLAVDVKERWWMNQRVSGSRNTNFWSWRHVWVQLTCCWLSFLFSWLFSVKTCFSRFSRNTALRTRKTVEQSLEVTDYCSFSLKSFILMLQIVLLVAVIHPTSFVQGEEAHCTGKADRQVRLYVLRREFCWPYSFFQQ